MKTHFHDVRVTELVDHPGTPSRAEEGDYKHLAHRLRQEDFLELLLVVRDSNGTRKVVDGHLRLRAAIEANFATVPVIEVTADDDETDDDLEILALTQMLNETTRPISKNRKAESVQRLCELERVGDNDRSQRAVADRLGMSEGSLRNWLNRAWLLAQAVAKRTSHSREEIEVLSQQDVRAAVAALKGETGPADQSQNGTTDKPGHAGLERTFRIVAKENPTRVVDALRNAVTALKNEGIDLSEHIQFTTDQEAPETADGNALIDLAGFNRLIGYHYGSVGGLTEVDKILADTISEESGESLSADTVRKIRLGTIQKPSAKKIRAFANVLGDDALTKAGKAVLQE